MRRVIVAAAVAAIAVGLVAPVAGAATKDAHGWWWRAQTGLLGTAIPPPGVPEDGLAVEALPDGPTAIAAVRYLLDKGESQPVLELTVADRQGEIAIQACAATQLWRPDHGGPWGERPTYDCGSAVEGEPSRDGTTWQWELSTLLVQRRLNVVLVPAPGSGRVTFEPPDDGSLRTTRDSDGERFDPPPVSDFTDPEPSSGGAPSGGGFSSPATTGSSGSQPPPFSPPASGGAVSDPAPGALPPPAMAAPGDAAGVEPPSAAEPLAPFATPPPTAQTIPASSDSSRTIGAVIAAMATMLALGLWHQDSAIPRRVGALTKAGVGVPPQSYGGLGRFTRARTGSPRPLL